METVKKSVFVDETTPIEEVESKKEFEEKLSDVASVIRGKNLKIELLTGKVLILENVLEFVFGACYFYYIKGGDGGTVSIHSDTIKNVWLYSPISEKYRRVLIPKFKHKTSQN